MIYYVDSHYYEDLDHPYFSQYIEAQNKGLCNQFKLNKLEQ